MTIPAGTRFGPYEVLSPLGAGGMGEVYRARDVRLGREVALKVLPEEVSRDKDRLARFEQEARAASALNHPNIVTIHDIGESGSVSYIAMELVEGQTLREIVVEGPMPQRRLLSVAPQIAEGLAKAHAAGIVHRDLKPENLMVTKDGYVKILDFGLSKLAAPESGEVSAMPTLARPETHPGTVLGTVAYMSPEQAGGRAVDYRSDQFSLGSILYEMAAGRKAFQGDSAAETMSAIIREEPEPLAAASPKLPPPFRWIVERCLAKDPEERYASTRDLARDLAGVRDRVSEISGAQVATGAPESVRRSLPPAALIAAAVILAVGAAGGWLAARTSRPRASAAPSFRRVDFRPGTIANARFTPDGQSVIYGANHEGEPSERLYQARLDSPETRRFDIPPADIFSISSAGEMAIRLVARQGPDMLARMPLGGGVPREVIEGVPYASADWGPDGKSLAIVRQTPGRFRLEYPMGKVLLESAAEIQSPRFSPDGRYLAFHQVEGAGTSVAIIAASGGDRRVLTSGWAGVIGVPGWSPDGREVWFTAASPGQQPAIHAVDRSGRVRLVARVPGQLELDDISRDGRVLVGHHAEFLTLMGTTPGDSKERDLSWLDGSNPVDISVDGRNLLVAEEGEGGGPNFATYLRPTDGSPPVRLGDGYPGTLSRDGSWVAVELDYGQALRKPHFVILPTGAGEPRSIPNEMLADFQWVNWLPDGKRLVVSGFEPGHATRLWIQDIAGGKPRPITPEGFRLRPFGNSVSPDGSLVLCGTSKPEMALCPTGGGEPKPIPGLQRGDIAIQWSADGKALYVYRRQESPAKVFLLDLATGQKRLWKEIHLPDSKARGVIKLVVTPDGSAYAYSCNHYTSVLYVIDGLR
jgi:Tol biopolymer transport system component